MSGIPVGTIADVIVGVTTVAGAALMFLAGVGAVRLRDLYSRIHAIAKAPTLGMALISLGGAMALDEGRGKILLAVTLIFITAPSAAHFIGRAAYRAADVEHRLDGDDDLAAAVRDHRPQA